MFYIKQNIGTVTSCADVHQVALDRYTSLSNTPADYNLSNWATTDQATRRNSTDFTFNVYVPLTLNATGIATISKTGTSPFGLRDSFDMNNTAPTVTNSACGAVFPYSANTASPAYLEVTYTLPPTPPTDLQTEGQTNPIDITNPTPSFSAVYNDPDLDDTANQYRLQVSASLTDWLTLLWDSGTTSMASTTQDQRSPNISYAGLALASSTTYYWRIAFVDQAGLASPWSTTTASFSLAAAIIPPITFPSDGFQNLTYTYDHVGNITQIVDRSQTHSAATTTYTYDDLNRLTSASTSAASTTPYNRTYTYSAIGNITEASDLGAYTYAGTGYANPHAVTSINGQTYTYDQSGNLTSSGSTANSWDYQNHLIQSGNGIATSTYAYDQGGNRVRLTEGSVTTLFPNKLYHVTGATTTKHLFAGDELVATIEGNGTATTTNTIHLDHLGGTSAVTNASGTLAEVVAYYPFGQTRLDEKQGSYAGEKRKFTGHQYDDQTGLYYMNARYQNPSVGRFISQDPSFLAIGDQSFQRQYNQPLSQFLANPQQLNSYSYVNNNPLTLRDPDGKCPICVAALIGGGVGFVGGIASQAFDDYLTGDFANRSWQDNVSTYSVAGGQGAIVGAGVAISSAVVAAASLAAIPAALTVGGTAGVLTAGTTLVGDRMLGRSTDPLSLAVSTGVAVTTAGTLDTLPKVPGRMPKLFGNSFFTGAHTTRQGAEEFYSSSMQALGQAAVRTSSSRSNSSSGTSGRSSGGSSVNAHWSASYTAYAQRRGISQ